MPTTDPEKDQTNKHNKQTNKQTMKNKRLPILCLTQCCFKLIVQIISDASRSGSFLQQMHCNFRSNMKLASQRFVHWLVIQTILQPYQPISKSGICQQQTFSILTLDRKGPSNAKLKQFAYKSPRVQN